MKRITIYLTLLLQLLVIQGAKSNLLVKSSMSLNMAFLAVDELSPPGKPIINSKTTTSIELSWQASSSGSVAGYKVYRNDTLEATVYGTTALIDNLTPDNVHQFTVIAYDNVGNQSKPTNSIWVHIGTESAALNSYNWPSYGPNLSYDFRDEYPNFSEPTRDLDDCAGVAGTLSDGWWTFKWGPNKRSVVTEDAIRPMLERMNQEFQYFRDTMGWPPDHRAKNGYRSAIYLYGSGLCTDNADSNALGGWQGNIYYNGENWPMVLASYYPVYSFDPDCPYEDAEGQQGAMIHEGIHAILASLPGCKEAGWFHEGGNTYLQQEAYARQHNNFNIMGTLNGCTFLAPFMPIECYSGWLQDGSFGGPSAEGVNRYDGSQQLCTWRNYLGGNQYGNSFPTFLSMTLGERSVPWIWRYCPSRVLEGMADGLGHSQISRLLMEYRAKQALLDMGNWSNNIKELLYSKFNTSIQAEYEPAWLHPEAWMATPYVKTTLLIQDNTLIPEQRTTPGWSGANQIPLNVAGEGDTVIVDFTPLDENMTCQLCYRAVDGTPVYSNPVTEGNCKIYLAKRPANDVVIAVITNTNYVYEGEETRIKHFDYRLKLIKGVKKPASIYKPWFDYEIDIEDDDDIQTDNNLALLANATTSYCSPWETLDAVNDNSNPANSNDKSSGAYGNWNNPNSTQWVQYEWSTEYMITSTDVYWFDDNGGVLTPTTAYVEYWNGSAWVNCGTVPKVKDSWNTLAIDNIVTSKFRISMLNTQQSTGILEWKVFGEEVITDNQPPSVPGTPVASNITGTGVTLTWTASTDNVGIAGYQVLQNGSEVTTVTGTSANISGLTQNTSYSFTVKAYDASNNYSSASGVCSVTTLDTQAPSVPGTPVASNITGTSVTLTWTASTDNVGVSGYQVLENGSEVTTVTGLSANITGLTQNTSYSFTVKAFDASNNYSSASGACSVTTINPGSETNIALIATASTSYCSPWETLSAVNDNSNPSNSNDKSSGAYGNWYNPNSIQWVEYAWSTDYEITSTEVYWFDDNGGVLTPTTAYVEYWDGSTWVNCGTVPKVKDAWNTLPISNVVASKLRISMLNTQQSTGILEWRVYGTEYTTPPVVENLALTASVSTSYVSPWETLGAVNDSYVPANSSDNSNGAYGNWEGEANYNTWNWVEYDFGTNCQINSTDVYWWDDGLGIAAPYDANIEYWNGSSWISLSSIGTQLNQWNTIGTDVVTDKLRVNMVSERATGILEWQVFGYAVQSKSAASIQNESDITHEISIFPNPAKEYVFISLPGSEIFSVTIFNSSGQLVYSEKLSGDQIITSGELGGEGIYFVRIQNNEAVVNQSLLFK